MAKRNILEVILNTINDVQAKNAANPREETADPNVFDLLKDKISNFDQKNRAKRAAKGKSPNSILDMIRKEIESARKENKRDSNVATAPSSVYDNIIKKVDEGPRRQATAGLAKIIQDYSLEAGKLPKDVLRQVHGRYIEDRKKFDQQFAQALHDLIKKY